MRLVYAIYMVPNSTEPNNDMCAIYSLCRQKPNFCRRMTSLSHHVSRNTIDAVCNIQQVWANIQSDGYNK